MSDRKQFGRAVALAESLLSDAPTVVIIGGGAAGTPLAAHAVRCGFRVFVVDENPTPGPGAASQRNHGWLHHGALFAYASEADAIACARGRDLWNTIAPMSTAGQSRALAMAESHNEAVAFEAACERLRIHCRKSTFTPRDIGAIRGHSLFEVADQAVDGRLLYLEARQRIRAAGGVFVQGATVSRITGTFATGFTVTINGGAGSSEHIAADAVVIAAGAATTRLSAALLGQAYAPTTRLDAAALLYFKQEHLPTGVDVFYDLNVNRADPVSIVWHRGVAVMGGATPQWARIGDVAEADAKFPALANALASSMMGCFSAATYVGGHVCIKTCFIDDVSQGRVRTAAFKQLDEGIYALLAGKFTSGPYVALQLFTKILDALETRSSARLTIDRPLDVFLRAQSNTGTVELSSDRSAANDAFIAHRTAA